MKIRLYVKSKLASGTIYELDKAHSNYLANVLRLKAGEELYLFNENDGEFLAKFLNKKELEIGRQTLAAVIEMPLILLFAPVKFGKIDMLAQKATELGVTVLQPVHTKRTHISRINYDRLAANCIEAAEQTGRITIPDIKEAAKLEKIIDDWNKDIKIIFCDDSLEAQPVAEVLKNLPKAPYAVLIGPEGGFAPEETAMLKKKDFIIPVSLGKRLLRAETAALAALAVLQSSAIGNWND